MFGVRFWRMEKLHLTLSLVGFRPPFQLFHHLLMRGAAEHVNIQGRLVNFFPYHEILIIYWIQLCCNVPISFYFF